MKAVLLAAGKGTRLGQRTAFLPKPLIRIDGKPNLEHNLLLCKKHGIHQILINLHHRPEMIENYFGDGSKWGVRIKYKRERKLLGTAGAIKNFETDLKKGPFLVLYGDNQIPYDLNRLQRLHTTRKADMTICVFKKKDVRQSGVVQFDKRGSVRAFLEKSTTFDKNHTDWVNAGVYILNPELLRYIPLGFSDFGRDIVPLLLQKKKRVIAAAMKAPVKAIDTPKLLARWKRKKEKAVFLDRDGVLNEAVMVNGQALAPSSLRALKIIPGVAEKLLALHERGFLLIVATNQPDVERGLQTREVVESINKRIREKLILDDIRVCYKDKDPYYKKPAPGMLLDAARDWGIDLKKSYMIGDRWKDIEAGKERVVVLYL